MNVRKEDAPTESTTLPTRPSVVRVSTISSTDSGPIASVIPRRSTLLRNEFIPKGLQRKSNLIRREDEQFSEIKALSTSGIEEEPMRSATSIPQQLKEPKSNKRSAQFYVPSYDSIVMNTLLPYTTLSI